MKETRKRNQTKQLLIDKGAEILHRKGFNDAGIQEVLRAAGVPKGSFYHHFKNKEDFGLQVIELYSHVMLGALEKNAGKNKHSYKAGIKGFFREMTAYAVEHEFSGCPLGNLSQELGDTSEVFRAKLNSIFSELEAMLAKYLAEAQNTGEMERRADARKIAVFLVSSWEGALLRMKLTKNKMPYEIFEQSALSELFG